MDTDMDRDTSTAEKPFKDWDTSEVSNWLSENGLPSVCDIFEGWYLNEL